MSRIAVISDIHGNLPALEAVLAEVDAMGVRDIVCLGDVVGYGPQPCECLDLVLDRCLHTVRGNHDEAVFDDEAARNFNPHARKALEWTRQALLPRHVEMLRLLPYFAYIEESVLCVHASPVPGPTDYIHDAAMAARAFRGIDTRACLIGHTHVPAVFEARSRYAEESHTAGDIDSWLLRDGQGVVFQHGCRYICNPGAVGQPRDNDPRASFAILEMRRGVFSVHRVAYDVDAAQAAARRAGLPSILAERLAIGA